MKQNSRETEKTKILWTGGWDSTYRLVELSRKNRTIEPIYVYGDNRLSERNEIKAMNKILSMLKNKKETKAHILPINFIEKTTIPQNKEITKAYNQIISNVELGSQYEWLASLAELHPGLELGIEYAPEEVSGAIRATHKYGHLVYDEKSEAYVLDKEKSSREGVLVFGNFKFPIIEMDGQEMKDNIQKWGYMNIMSHVWVCHSPYFGKPCGICNPCKLKIETNMEFLMTSRAIKRYNNRNKQPNKFFQKVERKFFLTLNNMRMKFSTKS